MFLFENFTPNRIDWTNQSNNQKESTTLSCQISPLFHENKFITDFKKKAELFNHFFCKSMRPID